MSEQFLSHIMARTS